MHKTQSTPEQKQLNTCFQEILFSIARDATNSDQLKHYNSASDTHALEVLLNVIEANGKYGFGDKEKEGDKVKLCIKNAYEAFRKEKETGKKTDWIPLLELDTSQRNVVLATCKEYAEEYLQSGRKYRQPILDNIKQIEAILKRPGVVDIKTTRDSASKTTPPVPLTTHAMIAALDTDTDIHALLRNMRATIDVGHLSLQQVGAFSCEEANIKPVSATSVNHYESNRTPSPYVIKNLMHRYSAIILDNRQKALHALADDAPEEERDAITQTFMPITPEETQKIIDLVKTRRHAQRKSHSHVGALMESFSVRQV